MLDIGCGDGLLAQRLATVSRSVTALDPDTSAVDRARARLASDDHVTVSHTSFDDFDPGGRRFDVITFVASLHHMDLRASLQKARGLLTPAGEIAVVGLAANTTVRDWLWALTTLPAARAGSWWHRETRDIGVVVAEPREGLDEIRAIAREVLPGARVRRGMYFRYRLSWGGETAA